MLESGRLSIAIRIVGHDACRLGIAPCPLPFDVGRCAAGYASSDSGIQPYNLEPLLW